MSDEDDDKEKEKDIEKRISAVTSILFATTILSFFVLIILLLLRLTIYNFTKGSDNTIIKTGHSVYYIILVSMSIVFLISLCIFIVSVYIFPDKNVENSIGVIIDNYEDITIITIMQFLLLIVYKLMEYNNKVHETFVLFMSLFTIGIIRLLLLLSKSDWSFKNIDNKIKEEIRYSNELKTYKCVNGEPTFSKNPVKCVNDKPIYDLDILDDDDSLTINFISPLDKIFTSNKINTFFWVKLYYIILVLVTVIGLIISTIEFFKTYFTTNCEVSDANEKNLGMLNMLNKFFAFISNKKETTVTDENTP